jgi:hypothetical protein
VTRPAIPTIVAHTEYSDSEACITIDDGWGVAWRLVYVRPDAAYPCSWELEDGYALGPDGADEGGRCMDPPEDIVALGARVLRDFTALTE